MNIDTTERCRALLCKMYSLYCCGGGKRIELFEELSQCQPNVDALTIDDYRNWHDMNKQFHSPECFPILDSLYHESRLRMSKLQYHECSNVFECIDFILEIAANASSHQLTVSDRLEDDWRDYDRLDVPEERERFYRSVIEEFRKR